jgi:hypothetical protein
MTTAPEQTVPTKPMPKKRGRPAKEPAVKKQEKFTRFVSGENFGLLETLTYVKDEFGFVDWRALIPKQFLFINEEKYKLSGKEVPESIEGVDDSMILIMLGGIKWLARARGYKSISFDLISTTPHPVVKCSIDWAPNFEHPMGVHYEEIASCNPQNADAFSLKYAESIAANRAFVRCVRNFLNINIVGDEEIFKNGLEKEPNSDVPQNSPATIDPQSIFVKICKEKGMSFEDIKKLCVEIEPTMDDCENETDLIKNLSPKDAKKLLRSLKKPAT